MMAGVRNLIHEPLVHFAVLGGLMFALHSSFSQDDAAPIRITDDFVDGLKAERTRIEGDAGDEADLLAGWLREEVLVREARQLGLDHGDPIVRRRLVQKMEFLLRASAEVPEPTDAELEAWRAAHATRYRLPPKVAFEHVFFSKDRRTDPLADARAALAATDRRASARPSGDPFLRGASTPLSDTETYKAQFGASFGDALAALPDDEWAGPLESRYGAHLVRVTDRAPGGFPPLSTQRHELARAWDADARDAALEDAVAALIAAASIARETE